VAIANQIRVGVVGVGWGALVNAPAFRAVHGFELKALCSRRPQSVAEAGERLGVSDLSTDWRSFIQRDDLDLIAVSTPVTEHAAISIAALEAGKHVLCEKPAALDAQTAERMVQAAARSGRATAMCYTLRWSPFGAAIWQLLDEGFVGTPYVINIFHAADYWHPKRGAQSPWMYQRSAGGGYLMGLQTHHIDLVLKWFGAVEAVSADVRTTLTQRRTADGSVLDIDADDTANVSLRLKSGVTVLLSSTTIAAHGAGTAIEIYGSDGTIRLERDGTLKAGKATDKTLETVALPEKPLKSGANLGTRRSAAAVRYTALLLEEWLPAFSGQPTPRVPSFHDGWQVQRVIDAARASSEGAGWVRL